MTSILILGAFPLSDVSLMTDEERERFLPVTRTFVKVLENDNATPEDINLLVEQSSELANLIPGLDGQTGKQLVSLVLFLLHTPKS